MNKVANLTAKTLLCGAAIYVLLPLSALSDVISISEDMDKIVSQDTEMKKIQMGYYIEKNTKTPIYVCDFVKFPPKDNKEDCIFYMQNEGLKSENYQKRLDQGDLLWIKPEAINHQIYRQVSNTVVRTPLVYWQSLCRIKQDSGLYVGHVPYVKGTICTARMPQNGEKIESKQYEVLVYKTRDSTSQLYEKSAVR